MKKFKLLVALLAVATVITLTGCGSKTDLSKYAGTYNGEYTKYVGDNTKITDEEFSVELKSDGTGSSTRDGATYDITWSLDGDKFKMTEKFAGLTIDYEGTLKDSKLDIFNGDKEDNFTVEYVYSKK